MSWIATVGEASGVLIGVDARASLGEAEGDASGEAMGLAH